MNTVQIFKLRKILKALLGTLLKKGWDWLSNSALIGTIAESPAIMTASGWKIDRNGKAKLDLLNTKEVKLLRNNLTTIGEAGVTAPTLVGDVEGLYNVVRHPVLTYNTIKKGLSKIPMFRGNLNLGEEDFIINKTIPKTAKEYKTNLLLAEKVDLARNLDALQLTKNRLKKGGHLRITEAALDDTANQGNIDASGFYASEANTNYILGKLLREELDLSKQPIKGNSLEVSLKAGTTVTPKDGGMGVFGKFFTNVLNDTSKKYTGLRKANKGAAHEFVHYFYWPFTRPKGFNFYGKSANYFSGGSNIGSGEIAARGTLLKNYYGLKEGEELTPEMWNYAKNHYVTDVGNNKMTELFNSVDTNSPEFPLFLLWLNKHAPAIGTGITVVGTTKKLNNNE